jgi:hypothetical protein
MYAQTRLQTLTACGSAPVMSRARG